MVNIYIHKNSKDAVVPEVAYNNTSAAFDITSIDTVTINPGETKVVPNGLNISVNDNDPYYMVVMDRSSLGFKKDLQVFQGVIDAGYTGDFGIKMRNLGKEAVTINKGDKYAQVIILPKNQPNFIELNDEEFKDFENQQLRGSKGFGSSNKK